MNITFPVPDVTFYISDILSVAAREVLVVVTEKKQRSYLSMLDLVSAILLSEDTLKP